MDSQERSKPFAVIVGLGTLQGLQAARILAGRNVPVVAIADDPKHFCSRTNVCHKIHFADTKSSGFIDLLENIGADFQERPVLIPCRDESVLLTSRHRERLARHYRFLLPAEDVVEMLMDKRQFYQFAAQNKFPVPRTFAVRNPAELRSICDEIRFPCIVKPPQRSSAWSENTAFKAFKVQSIEELTALYTKCRAWSEDVLIQEWIEGTDEDLYSCNCYFNADSEPLATFIARKIRQWPPKVGESSLGVECRNDEVLQETLRLFAMVGFRGLGYLEMKRQEGTGRHFIIEPNIGRPTGRSAIAEAGGVELLYTLYCDLAGLPLPSNREQRYTGVKWIHLTRDMASALHCWKNGHLGLREWYRSVAGPKTFAVFSWRDPLPFAGDVQRTLKLLVSGRERMRRQTQKNLREDAPTDPHAPANMGEVCRKTSGRTFLP